VRFVDLMGLIDVCSSRLDGNGRADALTFLYSCLARWHRSEPGLVERLVNVVEAADVVELHATTVEATAAHVGTQDEADTVAQRLVARLRQGNFLGDEQVKADLQLLHELASGDAGEINEDQAKH